MCACRNSGQSVKRAILYLQTNILVLIDVNTSQQHNLFYFIKTFKLKCIYHSMGFSITVFELPSSKPLLWGEDQNFLILQKKLPLSYKHSLIGIVLLSIFKNIRCGGGGGGEGGGDYWTPHLI